MPRSSETYEPVLRLGRGHVLLCGDLGPTASMTSRKWVYSSRGDGQIVVPAPRLFDPSRRPCDLPEPEIVPGAGLLTLSIEHTSRKYRETHWGGDAGWAPPTIKALRPVTCEMAQYAVDMADNQPVGMGLVAFSFVKLNTDDAEAVYRPVVSRDGAGRFRYCPCTGAVCRHQAIACRHTAWCEDFIKTLKRNGLSLGDAGFQEREPSRAA